MNSNGVNSRFMDLDSWEPCSTESTMKWSARYHVRTLETKPANLVNLLFHISSDDLQHFQEQLPSFHFPVTFSADLQQVVLLHTLFRLHRGSGQTPHEQNPPCSCQEIALSPQTILRRDCSYEEEVYPTWYRVWLSPNSKYMAVTKRRGKLDIIKASAWGVWSITIWVDHSSPDQKPNYQALCEISVNSTNLSQDGFLAFHPYYPLVIISGDIETILWNFDGTGKMQVLLYRMKTNVLPTGRLNKQTIYHFLLSELKISPDGNYIYGCSFFKDSPSVIVNISPFIKDKTYAIMEDSYILQPSDHPLQVLEATRVLKPFGSSLSDGNNCIPFFASFTNCKPPAKQEPNEIAVWNRDGDMEMSTFRQFDNVSTVVRKTLKRGRGELETLAFLPESSKNVNITLLDPFADDEYLSLILTSEPRESYQVDDPRNLQPPKFIQRKKDSIREQGWPLKMKGRRMVSGRILLPSTRRLIAAFRKL